MFRTHSQTLPPAPLTPDALRRLPAEVLAPGHFYLAAGSELSLDHDPDEVVVWEVYHGRLLDVKQTRQQERFESWNLYIDEGAGWSDEPLLSLKLDFGRGQMHVVRALRCHVWEGYDSGGGVFLSREAIRWVRELVETVDVTRFRDVERLRDELIAAVTHAVIGASRLPLTSVESPLPGYALGRLHYVNQPNPPGAPWRDSLALLNAVCGLLTNEKEWPRLMQLLIQTAPPEEVARALEGLPLGEVLRFMVNEASLSPWTELVPRTLAFLDTRKAEENIDFSADWLIQLGRHLTAYDLITFHHKGANYPDALALDLLLKRLLRHIGDRPDLFADNRRRRRALRQAWLLRRFYEGHPVPEVPTSPGENLRVHPGQPRVPEEQFQHFARRPRRLYANDPLTPPALLQTSLDDLDHPTELRELGLAMFVDRPLGVGKRPGEPDGTILLAHLAFSRSLARQRLRYLHKPMGLMSDERHEALQQQLSALEVPGVPLAEVGGTPRPGTVAALDARQVADDFVFLRTTRNSWLDLCVQYKLSSVHGLSVPGHLILPVSPPNQPLVLRIYDRTFQPLAELRARTEGGFLRVGGVEYLAEGFDAGGTSILPAPRLG